MKKQTLFLTTALFGILALSIPQMAQARPYPADFEFSVAEGDGDPMELTDSELNDADVAQLTAEGDFLVPTYLLPTESEMKQPNAPVVTVTHTLPIPNVPVASITQQKTTYTTPVVTVSQTPQQQFQTTPAQRTVVLETKPTVIPVIKPQQAIVEATSVQNMQTTKTSAKKPLLVPLAPILQEETDSAAVATRKRHVVPSALADTLLENFNNDAVLDFQMPQDIKVSFYKDATALSGQTIKWIKAFALQTIRDPRLIVEIRLSQTNPHIQIQRLAVIKNALLGTGLSTHQILVTYTNRPADSLVIRAIPKIQEVEITKSQTASGKTVEKRRVKW